MPSPPVSAAPARGQAEWHLAVILVWTSKDEWPETGEAEGDGGEGNLRQDGTVLKAPWAAQCACGAGVSGEDVVTGVQQATGI